VLTYDEALNLNYYKKTSFTGWMNPLRFLIKMEQPEESSFLPLRSFSHKGSCHA